MTKNNQDFQAWLRVWIVSLSLLAVLGMNIVCIWCAFDSLTASAEESVTSYYSTNTYYLTLTGYHSTSSTNYYFGLVNVPYRWTFMEKTWLLEEVSGSGTTHTTRATGNYILTPTAYNISAGQFAFGISNNSTSLPNQILTSFPFKTECNTGFQISNGQIPLRLEYKRISASTDNISPSYVFGSMTVSQVQYVCKYTFFFDNGAGGENYISFHFPDQRTFYAPTIPYTVYPNALTSQNAYSNGYADGISYADSVINVDSASYNKGYNVGKTDGYNLGYSNGTSSGKTWFSYLAGVAQAPIDFLKESLSFEILGVSMYDFVCSLLAICGVVIILKVVGQ